MRRRTQPIGRHELSGARRHADFLRVTQHALPAPDGALRLEVAELERDAAIARIDEVLTDVAAGRGAHAPRQQVVAVPRQDDEFRHAPDLDAGARLDDLPRPVRFDGRRGLDVDALVDVAERRHDLPAVQLFRHVRAEYPHTAMILVVTLVRPPGDEQVVAACAQPQLARSPQAVDARRPRAQLPGRRGGDRQVSPRRLLRGRRHQPERTRPERGGRRGGRAPRSPPRRPRRGDPMKSVHETSWGSRLGWRGKPVNFTRSRP